jgi:hypothetical protein
MSMDDKVGTNTPSGPCAMPLSQPQSSGVSILPRQSTQSAPVVTSLQPVPTIPPKP